MTEYKIRPDLLDWDQIFAQFYAGHPAKRVAGRYRVTTETIMNYGRRDLTPEQFAELQRLSRRNVGPQVSKARRKVIDWDRFIQGLERGYKLSEIAPLHDIRPRSVVGKAKVELSPEQFEYYKKLVLRNRDLVPPGDHGTLRGFFHHRKARQWVAEGLPLPTRWGDWPGPRTCYECTNAKTRDHRDWRERMNYHA